MSLFNAYIQPLTEWLHHNPHWALLITFLISLSESLAIIGSIVPGSVTMTAIGILAGSGIMRVDLTLLAAILGAVAGDSSSYMLGYYYRDQLGQIWPFKRYPHWLKLGAAYFEQHGGKSVLIGRFFGPLRSIIPLIAGMMHMNQWRFFLANLISAIGWALLYVLPGVIIGAASNELSSENATRFFIYILLLLVAIWLIGILMKWLLIKVNRILSVNLHAFWLWSQKHPRLSGFFLKLTPPGEKNHYYSAALLVNTILCTLLSIVLSLLIAYIQDGSDLNQAVSLFLQSFRISKADIFFIYCSQFINAFNLCLFALIISAYACYKQNYRFALYIVSILLLAFFIGHLLSLLIHVPRPNGILISDSSSAYPNICLTAASALLAFLILYHHRRHSVIGQKIIPLFYFFLLLFSGLGSLYLGDDWLSTIATSWLIGLCIALYFWLSYRRHDMHSQENAVLPSLIEPLLLLSLALISFAYYYKLEMHKHQHYHKQVIISETQWWRQKKAILPKYRLNRIGEIRSIFNIQYYGSLQKFKQALKRQGWTEAKRAFLPNLLEQLSAENREKTLPLFSQLHNNKNSVLVMTYPLKNSARQLVLRLWRSNFHIHQLENPLWIGSVHVNHPIRFIREPINLSNEDFNAIPLLQNAFSKFNIRILTINTKKYKYSHKSQQPLILISSHKLMD